MPVRDAFTLIELLIAIAILGILASLLLPVLSQAKRQGRQTACLNNQRQFALGIVMYADDNDGVIPREKAFAEVDDWKLSLHHTWSAVSRSESANVWYNAAAQAAGHRPLAIYASNADSKVDFYAAASGFHCPEARFPADRVVYPMHSLAYNGKLARGGTLDQLLAAIQEPSRTVLMLDTGVPGEKKFCSEQLKYNGQPHTYARRFAVRHGRKGILAMADGSAAAWRGERVVETDPTSSNFGDAVYPQLDVVWTTDPARNPN